MVSRIITNSLSLMTKLSLSSLRLRYGCLRQSTLYVALAIGLLAPNVALFFSPYLGLSASIANILIPLGLYLGVLASGRKPGRVLLVWLPLLLLINAFQMVLFTVFSGEIIAVDMLLNIFSASSDEAGELLGGLILPIAGTLLLHGAIVVLAVRSWRSPDKLRLRSRKRGLAYAGGAVLLGLPFLWYAHYESPSYSLRAGVYPINVFYNIYVATGKLRQVAAYDKTSAGFTYQAKSQHPEERPEVYVFVLGETSRAYSWELYGYPRATNPRLMSYADDLVVYRDLTTQSNTTYKSVPILLSPADGEHANRLPQVKGILTAMKEAGFHTVFISNQPANRSFLDFFAYEADEHFRIRDLIRAQATSIMDRKPVYDTDMLPYLDRVLGAGHRKLFVVMHAYGAHWSYRDRYPASQAYFVPDDALGASSLERPKLINAYDNAIRYTDYLLDEVIRRLDSLPGTMAGMYYTADHGEDVFDDDRDRILHSSPSISYYQLHVPGVLWLSETYRSALPAKVQAARANADIPATSRSNFHTLMELAGIASPERVDSLSLMSPHYRRPQVRTYLNDRYECVPLSEMVTHPHDLEMWRRMHLMPVE